MKKGLLIALVLGLLAMPALSLAGESGSQYRFGVLKPAGRPRIGRNLGSRLGSSRWGHRARRTPSRDQWRRELSRSRHQLRR